MKYSYNIENLKCANCAKKVEDALNRDDNIISAKVNFSTAKLSVQTKMDDPLKYIRKIVKEVEPDVLINEGKDKINNKHNYIYLLLGGMIGLVGSLVKLPYQLEILLIIVGYAILLSKTLIISIKQLKKGIISENFLVVVSCLGAFALGKTREGLMVIFLYELGKVLEDKAVSKSRKSISDLMDIKEDTTNLKNGDTITKVSTDSVKKGSIIIVKEGEKISLDGIVKSGEAYLDTSAVTGESSLKLVRKGEKVISGTINKKGLLEIETTALYKDSTVNKILELVESATERKAKTETIVSKYASTYTISVLLVAILVSILLPIFTNTSYSDSIYKGLTILVISCPCAIAISVPLSYFSGIGRSSREGILIKGSNYLDNIKDIKKIIFDKTGTLTTGEFTVTNITIFDNKYSEEEILSLFAKGEAFSNHPIAKAIIKKYNKKIKTSDVKEFKEESGKGLSYIYNGKEIKIGNYKYCNTDDKDRNKIHLQVDNKVVASLLIEDEVKKEAKEVVSQLEKMNIKVSMFTGDSKEKATKIAKVLGIKDYKYEMLPQDKYYALEEILKNKEKGDIVSFVGDGINDSPVIALSDLGISMGGIAADSSVEASDIVIMDDNLGKIVKAIDISKKTNKIIKENLIFAISVKISVLILSIIGISSMWQAVFADVGVTIICILNTLRLLKK